MASGGISGVAVAVGTAGALLIYAGLRGTSPLQALRDVSSGKPPPIRSEPSTPKEIPILGTIANVIRQGVWEDTAGTVISGAKGAALIAAAQKYRGDKYSQAKRWQAGYSDCSSFVGKALKDIGIKPPGASVVSSYLFWNGARSVPKTDIQAGDLLLNGGHMAIALSSTEAIGQQNSRKNVQTGSISNIMYPRVDVVKRLV